MNTVIKAVNILFCALLALFIAAQYNDPDGPLWMFIYGVPMVWTALAAFRPEWLRGGVALGLLGLSLLTAAAATAYYWPTMPDWWQQKVWWEQETAREGMGLMIVMVALLAAAARVWFTRPSGPARAA